MKFTIFHADKFDKSGLNELNLYLKQGIVGIFALNKYLLKLNEYRRNTNKNKISDVFNLLLAKGIKHENLLLFSNLIHRQSPFSRQLLYILFQVLPDSIKEVTNFKLPDKKDITHIINSFFDLIDKSSSDYEKTDIIKKLMDNIIYEPGKKTNHGEIIFFERDKFRSCEYIFDGNNILLSLNLYYLGSIDILIKNYKTYYSVAFYCEEENTLELLKREVHSLDLSINRINKQKVYFTFYNNLKALEKIIEIISLIDSNNLIDIKA